jgi:hypothetical protein
MINSRKHTCTSFKKRLYNLKFFPLDSYCDIQLYPSFHNQWAVPQYIVAAHWPKKSLPVNILLCNLQLFVILDLGTKSNKIKS